MLGASDYIGGHASRRIGAYLMAFTAEVVGLVLLGGAVCIAREPLPGWNSLMVSAVAGGIGAFSLAILFKAMVDGSLSTAAPVSALLTAVVSIVVGALTEGLPCTSQMGGFGLPLVAVWLIARDDDVAFTGSAQRRGARAAYSYRATP